MGPEHVLAERWERALLVVAEDLEHDRLALDVLDEGPGHLHRNLGGERGRLGGGAGRVGACRQAPQAPPVLCHPLNGWAAFACSQDRGGWATGPGCPSTARDLTR